MINHFALTVLVVDDEAPARQRLTDLLKQDAGVATILESSNGRDALELIRAHSPDLVFLDVNMPEVSGPELISLIGVKQMPLTVFVTAYDQFAIGAFESNALDYLLKPFGDDRFIATMERARTRLTSLDRQDFERRLIALYPPAPPTALIERLVVKINGLSKIVHVADVHWFEGAGVYVTLHCINKDLLYRGALGELASQLNPLQFVRIHRSIIVNIDSIDYLEGLSHGEFEAVLKNGDRLRVSRTYRPLLEKRLGQSL
ncbi:two-component system LytT family response regulator [Oxalobacteraceae bacterium GrIS 2.11]